MKLEFESNAVSSPLVSSHVPSEFDEQHCSPEILDMLREGIKSAQDGDRAEARNLLLRVTEADPKNENAWLWLASISEYPEELLVFLNNVLQINPENERAIVWAKATKSLIAKTFVQRGIDAAKDDQKKFAKQCFLQAIVHDSESELAYLWLASVSDSTEEKMSHLHKVLSINPDNQNAQSSLRNAREHQAKTLLPKANTAAIKGNHDEARSLLDDIFADAPDFEDAWMLKAHISKSFDEKIAAFERVLEINPENPVARANVDSLKMFAGNSEEEHEMPIPAGNFSYGHDESGKAEEADPPAIEMPDDMQSFDSEQESESDELEAKDENQSEIQYHEEDSVAFEDVATPADQVEQASDKEDGYFESEDVFSVDAADAAPVADFQEEPFEEDSSPEDEPTGSSFSENEEEFVSEDHDVQFDGGSSPEAVNNVDHDYFSENVDVADEANEEFDEVKAAEHSPEEVKAAEQSENDSNEADFQYDAESSFEDDAKDEEAHQFEASGTENNAAEDADAEMATAEDNSEEMQSEADFDAAASNEPEMPSFESAENFSPELPSENDSRFRDCPYCHESNEIQAFTCHSCKAIFTISDIEMILSHTKADLEVISKAVERMEVEKSLRGVDVDELKELGIGYLNLKDYRKGFEYLQEATKKDPNDVILVSQIDALAVRLAEIEDHERDQETKTVGKRILVVDDSPTVRKLISGKLEKCGHEPVCAVDGMDALAKINEVVPDLILLDITMPRMDGYQVCKLIRGNEATKDVPVVMISGKDGFFDKVRGRMAGTSNYITKPFGPETLMKTVNEYIQ